jgi:hypothetical protein
MQDLFFELGVLCLGLWTLAFGLLLFVEEQAHRVEYKAERQRPKT